MNRVNKRIGHFTVVRSVNGSEAEADFVLIQTSPDFCCVNQVVLVLSS